MERRAKSDEEVGYGGEEQRPEMMSIEESGGERPEAFFPGAFDPVPKVLRGSAWRKDVKERFSRITVRAEMVRRVVGLVALGAFTVVQGPVQKEEVCLVDFPWNKRFPDTWKDAGPGKESIKCVVPVDEVMGYTSFQLAISV